MGAECLEACPVVGDGQGHPEFGPLLNQSAEADCEEAKPQQKASDMVEGAALGEVVNVF